MFIKKTKKVSSESKEKKADKKLTKDKTTGGKENIFQIVSRVKNEIINRVLIRPLITEKATNLSAIGKYLFEVAPKANKTDIKKAIKFLYKVNPIKVNIIKVRGKKVRYGKARGKTKNWKKAIVTLKKGEKIEFTEK